MQPKGLCLDRSNNQLILRKGYLLRQARKYLSMSKLIFILITLIFSTNALCQTMVDVNVSKKDEYYILEYVLDEPIKKIYFLKDNSRTRWTTDDKFERNKNEKYDIYAKKDGSFFESITVKIKPFYESKEKDYESFIIFSDGSSLIYTGYIRPEKIYGRKGLVNIDNLSLNILKSKEYVYTLCAYCDGNMFNSKGKHVDKDKYIYLGNIKPIEYDRFIVVKDNDISKDLNKIIIKRISALTNYYERVTGKLLTNKYIIFINQFKLSSSENFSGGVLGNQVQLTFSGEDGDFTDPHLLSLNYLVAHELFHLWNASLFTHKGSSWLHEGSADYMAYTVLLDLGMISKAVYDEKIEESLNICASRLGKYSIEQADENNDNDMIYKCGSFIHYSVDKSYGHKSAIKIWETLFSNREKFGYYNSKDWFKALNTSFNNKQYNDTLFSFVNNLVKSDLIIEQFKTLGWHINETLVTTKNHNIQLAFDMFKHLMTVDCSDFYFNFSADGFFITDLKCSQFKAGLVVSIDGYDHFDKDSADMYNEIRGKCLTSKPIMIGMSDGQELEFICADAPRKLLPYLALAHDKPSGPI